MPSLDSFLLGCFKSWNQIAVARNDGRMSDLMLGCQQSKVQSKQQVDTLLLKYGLSIYVVASKG